MNCETSEHLEQFELDDNVGCPFCWAKAILDGESGPESRWYSVYHEPGCYYSLTHATNKEAIVDTQMPAWLARVVIRPFNAALT